MSMRLCGAQVPDLSGGDDPDDAFSRIPYEKGFYFLYHLQVHEGPEEVTSSCIRGGVLTPQSSFATNK